jgi:hypothetical protein
MVTSGRVSTFLARERASQEAVVVYTFECAGSGAGEWSTASIISRFCALAPNPPGIIVKAGFDEQSSSAFITTKMPEAVALKAWVGAYQSFAKPGTEPEASPAVAGLPAAKQARSPSGDETAELSATELRALLAKTGPSPKRSPVENVAQDLGGVTAAFSLDTPAPAAAQSAGEFTRLFREANTFEPVQSSRAPAPPPVPKPSDATDAIFGELLGGSPLGGHKAAAPIPPKAPPTPAESSPGSFTREFMGLSGEKPAPAAEPWTPAPPQKEPGAFTREFMAVSQQDFQNSEPPSRPVPPPQKPVSSPPPATSFESIFGPSAPAATTSGGQAENQKSGAGEFTSFFRDPFESPGAPVKPIVVPDVASSTPTKPPVGDFTRMFGRDDISGTQPAPPPLQEPEPPQASPGSFTQMFGQPTAGKKTQGSQLGQSTLGTNPNVRPSFLEPSGVPAPPEAPRRATPVPAPPADSIFSRTPPSVAPPVNQPFMSRPGSNEATDVFRIPGGDAPPVEPAPSGPSEFTVFLSRSQVNAAMAPPPAGPSVPAQTFAPPSAPQPPPFQFTPPPPPPPPAPPAMRLPTAPAVPAAPAAPASAAPPKTAGFWPLIVGLTVLFAIGAMLVMYFALKH